MSWNSSAAWPSLVSAADLSAGDLSGELRGLFFWRDVDASDAATVAEDCAADYY